MCFGGRSGHSGHPVGETVYFAGRSGHSGHPVNFVPLKLTLIDNQNNVAKKLHEVKKRAGFLTPVERMGTTIEPNGEPALRKSVTKERAALFTTVIEGIVAQTPEAAVGRFGRDAQ